MLLRTQPVSSAAKQNASGLEAGIRSQLLIQHGRLLPDGLAQEEMERLAGWLRASDASDNTALDALPATFPRADELTFNGQDYSGGNLSFIDSILGKSKRPIAFDRAIPAMLVPVAQEAEKALIERRAAFQAAADSGEIRSAVAQAFGEGVSGTMFADGQFLRPYTGRFDDLYFHLFQNGNGLSAMAFSGLAEGLGERVYQPVAGLVAKKDVPAAPFDLNDILSDGGKAAVARQLRSAAGAEPFKGFAFRIFPAVVNRARSLPAGGRLTVSPSEVLAALRARQHFYPTQVPPLYRSPDRFLGWVDYSFVPVANKGPVLPPGAADSWYPLPQREGHTTGTAESAAEGAASAQLFESSSSVDIVWEDPQLSNLLADPEERTVPRKGPAGKSLGPRPRATFPKMDSDPRLRAAAVRLIVVVTPTAAESREYLAAIAASDEQIRTIEQARGRTCLLRKFLGNAPRDGGDLQQAIAADLAALDQQETEFKARLQDALQHRMDLRSELAERLVRDRVRPLETLGKESGEAATGSGSELKL
jgi:hypothetical protein